MTAWFDVAFGEWYPELYPHRNLEEARRAIAGLDSWIPSGAPVLDAGCGRGRHLIALAEAGRQPVGLDRSWPMLHQAAASPDLRPRIVRGDMRRLPFAAGTFGAVLSMFTSFGYFGTRRAHRDLLAEFARVAAPEGRLVLDYLNAPAVRRSLVPRSGRRVRGDHRVEEERRIRRTEEGEEVVKLMVIHDPAGTEVMRYEEVVALYDRDEVRALLEEAGWIEAAALGDYGGGSWSPGAERLLVVADREGAV